MKKRMVIGLLLIGVILVSGCTQRYGGAPQPATPAPAAAEMLEEVEAPDFTIVSPAEGGSITGTQVTVELDPLGVKIVPAGGAVREDEGHFHITLDGGTYKVAYTTSYTFNNVASGQHTIQVELVDNDHSPKDPRVVKTVTFTTMY